MQCRSLVAQLGRHYPDFQAENTEVLAILGASFEMAQSYARQLKLPFPVLADPKRGVYHRYGLHKFLLLQRTAAVIIDREGIVRYLHRATNTLTWLGEYKDLFHAVQQVNRTLE